MIPLIAVTLTFSLLVGRVPYDCGRVRPTVGDEYKASDAVVVGTVLRAIRVPVTRDYQDGTTYVVRVNENLKGKPPAQLRLFSENSAARFPMRIGGKYLLFIDHLDRSAISNCGNSGLVTQRAKALATVRRLRRVDRPTT
jgi:hypothetical protein